MHNMLQSNFREIALMLKEENRGGNKVLDLWLAAIITKGIAQGDTARLNFIFEQVYGKLKDTLELQLVPHVTYKTNMTEDGRLIQEVINGDYLDVTATNPAGSS